MQFVCLFVCLFVLMHPLLTNDILVLESWQFKITVSWNVTSSSLRVSASDSKQPANSMVEGDKRFFQNTGTY
jgi:hypothetical protein